MTSPVLTNKGRVYVVLRLANGVDRTAREVSEIIADHLGEDRDQYWSIVEESLTGTLETLAVDNMDIFGHTIGDRRFFRWNP